MLKRILFLSIIVLTTNLSAQHFISGWKAGINAMNPIFTSQNKGFSDRIEMARIGLELEVFKDLNLSDQMFLRTHAGYSLRTYNSNNNPGNGTFFSSVNLTGDLHYHISNRINLYSGLNIGGIVNVYHHFKYLLFDDPFTIDGDVGGNDANHDLINKTGVSITNSFRTIDVQWNLGLNYKLGEYWYLDLKHGRSPLNLNKSSNPSASKTYLQTISLGVVKLLK